MHAAMRDLSAKADTTLSPPREAALTEFGTTVATPPFDADTVQKALLKVEQEGGKELAVEACCTVAGFEAITRIVDATNRKEPPGAFVAVLKGINLIMLRSRELMLAGSAIAAVGIAAAIMSRRG